MEKQPQTVDPIIVDPNPLDPINGGPETLMVHTGEATPTIQWTTAVITIGFQVTDVCTQVERNSVVSTTTTSTAENENILMGIQGKVVYTKMGSTGTEQSPLLHYDALNTGDPMGELKRNPSSFRISQVILFLVLTLAGTALVAGLIFGIVSFETEEGDLKQEEARLGVRMETTAGARSPVGEYKFAAVAADAGECSSIGMYIMGEKRGSVVDAAIAALLCLGIHNGQSMGIGGGHFMMIYEIPKNETKRKIFSLDARETAPGAATVNMFKNASSTVGGLSIGIPGEIKGMHAAWSRFGHLPWRELFQPVLQLCRDGYKVGPGLGDAIRGQELNIRKDKMLTELYVKSDGTLYKEGDMMTSPRLADTLEQIAEEGPEVFYSGTLADDIISDIKECGGIITKRDLTDYEAIWRTPSVSTLRTSNYTINTMPPPSSGPALQYMLNILEGYNLTRADIEGPPAQRSLTYHRIAETFKFGYARRSFMGDPSFEDMEELIANMTSRQYADVTRSQITDDMTQDVEYYHPANHALPKAAGTSHLSIIGPDGQAVGVTSTINTFFGSKCGGRLTGIVFNDEMDDFNTPGDQKENSVSSSTANFIRPGKRPLSSMVPTIILSEHGEPVYVLGGSGGLHITSQVAYVTAHALWLGKKLNEAIDHPRLHHQLLPNVLNYEAPFDEEVLNGLADKGHVLEEKGAIAVIQGIYSCRPHCPYPSIYATSDFRKGGYPDGY